MQIPLRRHVNSANSGMMQFALPSGRRCVGERPFCIATSWSVSRNTVVLVCKRAAELHIQWPLDPSVTDKDLKEQLFPR